tara:strand:+ start:961 stop:1215 length:255 start_codon:yes stop_codon:yes gene_type:complete
LEEFLELKHLVTRKISFISEDQISTNSWRKAEKLTKPIDADDIAFVALALELNCPLWTGDKKIAQAVSGIEFLETNKLFELINV